MGRILARQVPKGGRSAPQAEGAQERCRWSARCRTNLAATRAGGRDADVAEVPALCGRHSWAPQRSRAREMGTAHLHSPTGTSYHVQSDGCVSRLQAGECALPNTHTLNNTDISPRDPRCFRVDSQTPARSGRWRLGYIALRRCVTLSQENCTHDSSDDSRDTTQNTQAFLLLDLSMCFLLP